MSDEARVYAVLLRVGWLSTTEVLARVRMDTSRALAALWRLADVGQAERQIRYSGKRGKPAQVYRRATQTNQNMMAALDPIHPLRDVQVPK